jgi:hypothetical protein
MMESPVCKMCGHRSDFVKAHILPQSFYPERDRNKDRLSVLSSHPSERKRHSRTGIYDTRLVCAGCEQLFDPLDNYAAKLLIEGVSAFRTVNHDRQPLAYQVDSYDHPKLKLFCLSLLWRAAASGQPEFASVNLGPYLLPLTDMIRRGDPGNVDTFSTILCRFSDIEGWQSGVISPVRRRYEGITFYSFVATAYVFHIKVDHQSVRDPLRALVIRSDAPLLILAQEFRDSTEFRTMLQLVKRGAGKRASPEAPRCETA